MSAHVEIEMTSHGQGTVKIDGVEVPMVAAVRFRSSVREPNRVLLVLVPDRVTVRAPAEISKRGD